MDSKILTFYNKLYAYSLPSGHYIAPKKGKRIETDRIKKAVSKQIDLGIEKSIHQQALTDGTEFRVLENNKPPPPTTKVSKTGPSISGPSKSGPSKSGPSKRGPSSKSK